MMSDRLFDLGMGLAIGYLLGLLTNVARAKHKHTGEPDMPATENPPKGVARFKLVNNSVPQGVALFLVVCLTLYAAITTQINANRVAAEQRENVHRTECTTKYLTDTISVINSRTTYNKDQAQANIDLVDAQKTFLQDIATRTQLSPDEFTAYLSALDAARSVYVKSQQTYNANDYPTAQELTDCLNS